MSEEKIFQVSEFNEFINLYLGKVGGIVIEGEITECKVSRGKWLFVTIKDQESSVDVFGITFQISGYKILEPGMLVHVYGIPRLYQKTGRFSVYANQIVPAGEGALKLAFIKLKELLDGEGLFDEQRKRTIAEFPEKIGLITAKDSRAYSDFIKVLKHRMGGIKIFFYPASVQGKDSVKSIVKGFDYFNNNHSNLDALVLIRGGGSLEDLQSFNNENLARAIFSSKVPVVCGVGHEDDFTIADLVSDLRASTPSNAAELIVRNRDDVLFQLRHNLDIINKDLESLLSAADAKIRKSIYSLGSVISSQVLSVKSSISKFVGNFALFKQEALSFKRNMYTLARRVWVGSDTWLKQQQIKVENMTRLLNSYDIQKTMQRGFSITFNDKGKILKTVKGLDKGSLVTTKLFDGRIGAQVLTAIKK